MCISSRKLTMETSVEAAEVLVPPTSDKASSLEPESSEGETAGAACSASSPDNPDSVEQFSRRLDDIIHMYSSAAGVLDKQVLKVNNTCSLISGCW